MRRYCKNFKFTTKFISLMITECLEHKTKHGCRWYRRDVSEFLAEYYIKGNFEFAECMTSETVAAYIRENLLNEPDIYIQKYSNELIPYIAKCFLEEINNKSVQFSPIEYHECTDPSSGKLRLIGTASVKQQMFDYIIVGACKEMFFAKIGVYQCSSLPGRGQIYAKKRIEHLIRKKHKHTRHAVKLDIKKCYPSIRHDLLLGKLERDIKNEDILYVIKTLLKTYSETGIGLCIGTYLSQYLANYYLSYAYHYCEQLYTTRKTKSTRSSKRKTRVRLVYSTVFYMDDILMLSPNKKHIKKAVHLLIEYLHNECGLEVKNNTYQYIDMYKPNAFIDMVGFRIYKDHTEIRERIYNRVKADIKLIKTYKEDVDLNVARSFMSRNGYVKHSNSLNLKRKTKYPELYEIARKVVNNNASNNSIYGRTAVS